jgi:acyl carrier protein
LPVVSLEELACLFDQLLPPGTVVTASTQLRELGLDSFGVFELLVRLDEAGVDLPDGLWESLTTIEDLHRVCLLRAAQRGG